MKVIGIDPGPEGAGVVLYDSTERRVLWSSVLENDAVEIWLVRNASDAEAIALERVACYGRAVGADVFLTAESVGYFAATFVRCSLPLTRAIYLKRPEVCLALCGSRNAKPAETRARLRDLHGGAGAVGTKKNPGPLHGVKSHSWEALAVAVVATLSEKELAR